MSLHSALRVPRSALLLGLLLTSALCPPSSAIAQDDPFAAGVRTTPWLSPADEQKAFKLPPGFEIQLVAAEPDIQKPLNMAFDERGRIWLTCSVEYPYAAPPDRPGRDCIKILEDTDGDGRFEKIQTFADDLNIPIGICPWKGGCIAWSIPNIWHFEDTNGDGKCDKRTVLYGPFDTSRDTHGMVNSLRRGFDGWVYACHGFNNDSRVKGKDGHEVHLNSGNTFRFRLDGSRIEHFTHGQVNPFGMCFDELFNIFTADCHSKPIYQLLRGGYYPSFGKPHDGLGFVPPMMDHLHGSTAICGLVKYSGANFPQEYRGDFLSGNVMTSRINRNKPKYHGSTIKAVEQPDFLSTSDPWFRPVDLQIGPDGALYIADFYNRIIGHYEVPLPHPGRDRTSGRIWRVVYAGARGSGLGAREPDAGNADKAVANALRGVPGGGDEAVAKPGQFDLTKMSIDELIAQLDSPQLEHRLRVLNYLVDVRGNEKAEWEKVSISRKQPGALACGIWLEQRLGLAKATESAVLSMADELREVRVHATKALAEFPRDDVFTTAPLEPRDGDWEPFQTREAAEAIGRHGELSWVPQLLHNLSKIPAEDPLLSLTIRMAIRDQLAKTPSAAAIHKLQLRPQDRQPLADIAVAVNTPAAASLLIDYVSTSDVPREKLVLYLRHAARYAPSDGVESLIALVRNKFAADIDLQASILLSLHAGLAQRPSPDVTTPLSAWGENLSNVLLAATSADTLGWTALPVEGLPASENPWVIAARPCADGKNDQPFYYSLPKGEQRTGIYRSAAFELPEKLSFWCAGHSGFPGKPLNDGNWVRLRDATTHAVLAESRPPRNDVARRIEWDLSKAATIGREGAQSATTGRGYVELVDGDTGDAYAWLAIGRFSLNPLNPGPQAGRQQLAAEIVGKLKLASLRPQLAALVASPRTDGAARAAIGQALVALDPDSRAAALVAALNEPVIPLELRTAIGRTLARSESEGATPTRSVSEGLLDNLREVMQRAPSRLQTLVAETLAGDAAGADALLTLVEAGHASPRLLLAPGVSSKLVALKNIELDERVAAATARLPATSETLDKLIAQRRGAFAGHPPNLERGQAVFTKHCAACHQVAGQGAVVGPQLDGIGNRGLERIIEDVLDPNRNVDVAFQTTTMRLGDGRVVSGLFRREEGAQIVLADNQGKEFVVAKDEIDQQQKTPLSLMPANVPEIVPPDEFLDLVGWLLAQRQAAKKE
ncbi:MAG: PVC-type heme-binding CxxCH protein [Pirellulaceae bacterium]